MKRLIFFLLVISAFGFASAQAQDDEYPLIVWIRGDLYSVDAPGAAPVAVTAMGTISGPVLSPDGSRIAFKAAAQVGLDALNRIPAEGFIADFDLPGDIYLLDIAGRASIAAAGQPEDASLFVEGTPDNAVIRSSPVWSPDGTRLAWTEYAYPGGALGIVVYDIATGTLNTVAPNVPAPIVQGAAPPLRWGGFGFAVNASQDAAGDQSYLIYAADGTLASAPRLAAVENDPTLDYTWVESPNGSLLGILYQSGRWTMLEPSTGAAQAVAELPRLTTAAPDSRALTFGVDETQGFFWEVAGENAAAPGAPTQVTLSPSGRQIAFIGFPSSGAVSILNDDDSSTVPNTGSNLDQLQVGALLWGYTFWVIG